MLQADIKRLKQLLEEYRQFVYQVNAPIVNIKLTIIDDAIQLVTSDLTANQP